MSEEEASFNKMINIIETNVTNIRKLTEVIEALRVRVTMLEQKK